MLAVTVDLNIDIVAIMLGILVTALHRSTDTEVLRQINYVDAI